MASTAKRLVLITGASGGIGFELAAQLLAKGTYHVFLGSRSAEKGNAALQQLRSRNLPDSVEMLLLDVTKDETIEDAASQVRKKFGRLDVLVNNAAVAPMEGGTLRDYMRTAFDTNATGPLIVTSAFASLLKESRNSPRIVNITSGAGSISSRLNKNSPTYRLQGHQYRASKSALNMITACQYVEYEPDGITVLLYDPGHTISNLGPYNKAEFGARAPADSVRPLIEVIEGKRDNEAPKILHNTGAYDW